MDANIIETKFQMFAKKTYLKNLTTNLYSKHTMDNIYLTSFKLYMCFLMHCVYFLHESKTIPFFKQPVPDQLYTNTHRATISIQWTAPIL